MKAAVRNHLFETNQNKVRFPFVPKKEAICGKKKKKKKKRKEKEKGKEKGKEKERKKERTTLKNIFGCSSHDQRIFSGTKGTCQRPKRKI